MIPEWRSQYAHAVKKLQELFKAYFNEALQKLQTNRDNRQLSRAITLDLYSKLVTVTVDSADKSSQPVLRMRMMSIC